MTALRKLSNVNPSLYEELSYDTDPSQVIIEANEPVEGLAFFDTFYDGSDVSVDVVAQHLATGSRQVNIGYIVEEDGSLRRAAAVEDTDFEHEVLMAVDEVAPVFGRAHRRK